MLVKDYLKNCPKQISKRTLCFLLNNSKEVLLGKKKRGFGEGNYLGVGGKVNDNETVEQAAIREVKEEINVTPTDLEKMAVVTFLFPDKPNWNQEVHVFRTFSWINQPTESDEIIPKWFKLNEVPYNLMWDDNKYWLPSILEGKKLRGYFLFKDLKVISSEINPYN